MDRRESLLNVLNVLTPVVNRGLGTNTEDEACSLYKTTVRKLTEELFAGKECCSKEDNAPYEYETIYNGNISFGDAVELMKRGMKVSRTGWNGKGMYVFYTEDTPGLNPHFVLNSRNGSNTWVPSVSDCLSEDWQIV